MALSRLSSTATRLKSLTQPTPSLINVCRGALSTTESITIDINVPFTAHRCDPPSQTITTTKTELLTFFRDMATMRRMEIAADSLYKAKLIRGFCHLYDGQEAIAVGMEAAITKKDCVITGYRDHCLFLGRGGTLVESFAELMGRRDGCSNG